MRCDVLPLLNGHIDIRWTEQQTKAIGKVKGICDYRAPDSAGARRMSDRLVAVIEHAERSARDVELRDWRSYHAKPLRRSEVTAIFFSARIEDLDMVTGPSTCKLDRDIDISLAVAGGAPLSSIARDFRLSPTRLLQIASDIATKLYHVGQERGNR